MSFSNREQSVSAKGKGYIFSFLLSESPCTMHFYFNILISCLKHINLEERKKIMKYDVQVFSKIKLVI